MQQASRNLHVVWACTWILQAIYLTIILCQLSDYLTAILHVSLAIFSYKYVRVCLYIWVCMLWKVFSHTSDTLVTLRVDGSWCLAEFADTFSFWQVFRIALYQWQQETLTFSIFNFVSRSIIMWKSSREYIEVINKKNMIYFMKN